MARKLDPRAGQLSLEGIGQDVPLSPQPSRVVDAGHEAMREALRRKKGSKRQDYRDAQARQRTQDAPEVHELPKKTLAERMQVLRRTHGFYPTSRLEATQAFGLLHDFGTPLSTIKYLNEAFMRQSKEEVDIDDPRRTPLHMVLDFANHRDDANLTRILAGSALGRLSDIMNPNLSLSVVRDEVPLDLAVPLYRQRELDTFAGNIFNDYQHLGGTVLAENVMILPVDEAFTTTLEAFTDTTTVQQARLLAGDVMTQQTARYDFWAARVSEAHNHIPSRPMVARVMR